MADRIVHTGRGKWSSPGIPHKGWTCVGIDDLEAPSQECEMCESVDVHYMEHPNYPETLAVGCVCAEHMEDDYVRPRQREAGMRLVTRRRKSWAGKKWRVSQLGNHFINTEGFNLTVFERGEGFGISVARRGTDKRQIGRQNYPTRDGAKAAALRALLWVLTIIEPEGSSGNWSQKAEACLAAALLHDVGHGMFSHAFEKAMEFFLARNKLDKAKRESLEDAVDHEKVTQKIIIDSTIGKSLINFGGTEFPAMVRDIIKKADKTCIYTSVVSSQLDADRLDYAKRDAYFAGVSSGGIDLDWLLRNLKVGENGAARFLYLDSKAYISLEQFTVTLFQLYPTIYLHKKTRGLEFMFALLLSRVFELIAAGDVSATGLSDTHPFVRFFRDPGNLDQARLLDDTLFWGALHQFREASDTSVSDIATRISDRRILPMVDIWKVADEVLALRSGVVELTAKGRVDRIEAICKAVAAKIQMETSIWSDGCYYDTYNRPIYKPMGIVGGDPQQINVSGGGQILDIASISPLVASAASFNIHRIYYDDRKVPKVDDLNRFIRETVEAELGRIEGQTSAAVDA